MKSAVTGQRGVVSALNPEAARIGIDMLADGGTAFDAIVAMSFATAVRDTAMNGLGGGGVFMGYEAKAQRVREVNFYGRSPEELPEDIFVPHLDRDALSMEFGWPGTRDNVSQRGPLSVGVPAFVRGLAGVHRYATKDWAYLLEPAETLARTGFEPHEEDLWFLTSYASIIEKSEGARRAYLPNGVTGVPGSLMRLPDLADTIRHIRDRGERGFYEGPVARGLVDAVRRGGGFLSDQDLLTIRADHREGLSHEYHGYEIHSASGMLGGVTLLTMLNLARLAGLSEFRHNSAKYLQVLASVIRAGWKARFRTLSQPSFDDADLQALLSEETAQNGLRDIATESGQMGSILADWLEPDSHTTSLAAADTEGNIATITQTLGQCYGSGVMGDSTGVLLYDLTYWFNPEPGTASSVGGGKRPSGHATPVIVTREGKPVAALGAPGGRKIVTAMLQVIVNMVDHGMDVQEAIAAPRIHTEGVSPVYPHEQNDFIVADKRISPDVIEQLRRWGREVNVVADSPVRLPFARPTGVQLAEGAAVGGVDLNGKALTLAV